MHAPEVQNHWSTHPHGKWNIPQLSLEVIPGATIHIGLATAYTAATKSNSIDVFSILVIDFVIAIRSARICNVCKIISTSHTIFESWDLKKFTSL